MGEGWIPLKLRRKIISITDWTAKYSMLDVFVIAMLVLLVKVDEFVFMLPCLGLYLFSFAVLCSAVASSLLQRSFPQQDTPLTEPLLTMPPAKRQRWPYLPWLLAGGATTIAGLTLVVSNLGGKVTAVELNNLTKRPISRSMEKLLGLKEITKPSHSFWSKDTLLRLMEAVQTASTDAGWKVPQGYLVIETLSGRRIETSRQELPLDDPALKLNFTLPETINLKDIGSVELRSTVEFAGFVPAEASEERLALTNDPFRAWTSDWYGRLFLFKWAGPANPELFWGAVLAVLGALGFFWATSGLLCGGRQMRVDAA
jgi:hypothetical protein